MSAVADLRARGEQLAQARALRITVIAADGTVLVDSNVAEAGLSALENHRSRPEGERRV